MMTIQVLVYVAFRKCIRRQARGRSGLSCLHCLLAVLVG
jgi:hypothetical protein